jgi:methyl-accepting chemotaxis protein
MRSIGHYITLLAAAAVVAALAILGTSLWGSSRNDAAAQQTFVAKDVTADILPPPMYLVELRLVLSQAIEGTLPPATASKEIDRLEAEYVARVTHWTAHPPFGLESDLLGRQHESAQRFITSAREVIGAVEARGETDGSVAVALAEAHGIYLEHRAGVDRTVQASMAFAEASMAAVEATADHVLWVQCGVLAVAALALVVVGTWAHRSITVPIQQGVRLAQLVAAGDLTSTIEAKGEDEAAQLLRALRAMNDSLVGICSTVRQSSESIATGSAQIASGTSDLSHRTEEQAAALQEAAASMRQLSTTVKQNAEHARVANQLASGASAVASRGGEVVGRVVETMRGINDSSKRIADITGVIDGIAFQTNILALNAAVEAARAGEQGRGFAVVASEVRSLAHRSADAAKEIKALIAASVERVDQGTALVDQAGTTMDEVVTAIRRLTDLMGEISTGSAEQSDGVAQFREAVDQMDRATQENAALLEESAAAAHCLEQESEELVRLVAVFRLDPATTGVAGAGGPPRIRLAA